MVQLNDFALSADENTAELINNLITSGKYKEALAASEKMAEEANRRSDRETLGRAYLLISDAHYYLGRPDLYREYVEKALEQYLQTNDKAGIGRCYYNLSYVHERTNPPEMLRLLEKARPYAAESGDAKLQINVANATGTTMWYMGRYADSLKPLQESADISRKLNDDYALAVASQNIGLSHEYLGQTNEALRSYDLALRIFREKEKKLGVATVLGNIGNVYRSSGDPEKAEKYFGESLEIHSALGYKRGQLTQLMNIASIHYETGNYWTAIERNAEGLRLAKELGDQWAETQLLLASGMYHRSTADMATAERSLADGLSIAEKLKLPLLQIKGAIQKADMQLSKGLNREAWDTLSDAEKLTLENGDAYHRGLIFARQADILASQGKTREAISRLHAADELLGLTGVTVTRHMLMGTLASLYARTGDLNRARVFFRKSIDEVELLDEKLAFERFRIDLYFDVAKIFHGYARLLADAGSVREAWEIVERGRSRALALRVAQARRSPGLSGQERELMARLSTMQKRIREENLTADQLNETYRRLSETEEQYERLRKERTEKPAPIKLNFPAGFSRIIEYSVDSDEILVFNYQNGKLSYRKIQNAAPILQKVNFFLQSISNPGEGAFRNADQAKSLYSILVEPELRSIKKGNILIIPDNILHYLPFSALMDSDNIFLAKRMSLQTSPSLAVLTALRRKEIEAESRIIAMANTDFSDTADSIQPLPSLPMVAREAKMVGSLTANSLTLIDETETRFKSLDLTRYNILHFATHSLVDELNPERSSIVLGADLKEDGYLQAREIYRMKLKADLVVLSGCRSGTGKIVQGEGLLGLAHALFSAGANSMILSLWDVSDKGTAVFMTRFYSEMKKRSPAGALQQAQIAMMQSDEYKHPAYWAAFFGSGNVDRKLSLQSKDNAGTRINPWLTGFAITILVILIQILKGRRRQALPAR